MYGIIYCATNNETGQKYIGQTKHSLKLRKREHINEANRNGGFYFHKALRKYKFNFSWEVLKECNTQEELDLEEIKHIETYDTFNNPKGYNLTSGGDFCKKVKYSQEELDYIVSQRRLFKGKKEILNLFNIQFNRSIKNVGSIDRMLKTYLTEREEGYIKFKIKSNNSSSRIETEQSKINRSLAHKNKKRSLETREKISKAKKGFKHNPSSVAKMTLSNKRRINFTTEEINLIITLYKEGTSKRQILIKLNEAYNYKINITSTSVIDRVLKNY